ncbi:MAG: hypothetical protein ABH858_02840 [Candidatus Omnitrophota bacterium]
MHSFYKKIFNFIEAALLLSLVSFFLIRITTLFLPPKESAIPRIENNSIYLTGRLNKKAEGYSNLISFDYSGFLSGTPLWNKNKFTGLINKRTLFVTTCQLNDFTNHLLDLKFPYWEKGGVEIAVRINDSWHSLSEFIDIPEDNYSLDDLIFLGLGIQPSDLNKISENDFISSYFKGKTFSFNNNRVLYGKNVLIRFSSK